MSKVYILRENIKPVGKEHSFTVFGSAFSSRKKALEHLNWEHDFETRGDDARMTLVTRDDESVLLSYNDRTNFEWKSIEIVERTIN